MKDKIVIHGAREHNLKNINLEIPRDKIVVITGLSGSGKSSLAFDTIYAEGQRRYVESLSTYARQFFGNLEKPDFDWIENLSPAISIDQRSASQNPRSTVGTVTEIYDYLRVLFARIGHPHCPTCNKVLVRITPEEMVTDISKEFSLSKQILFFAPQVRLQKGEHKYLISQLRDAKITKVRIDGILVDTLEAQLLNLDKSKPHTIEALIEEVKQDLKTLSPDAFLKIVEKALKLGQGNLIVTEGGSGKEKKYSKDFTCPKCQTTLDELHPKIFSFNSPQGACPVCQGLGRRYEVDPDLVLPNPRLTLAEGAIRPWSRITSHINWYNKVISEMAKRHKFSLDTPVGELPRKIRQIVLYGDKAIVGEAGFEGVIPNLERRYKETDSDYLKSEIEKYMVERICPDCGGKRLRREVLSITIGEKNIVDITSMSIEKLHEYFNLELGKVSLSENEKIIASKIVNSISERLKFLLDVGLGYLTLDRNASTLAGGEAQRIRLATQLGTGLMGVIYVLDEPSIGLHPRDHEKLLKTFDVLKNSGNSVIVVEHDPLTIEKADWVVDIGPGAGDHGGKVVAEGTLKDIMKNPDSLTGQYLSGAKKIEIPKKRRPQTKEELIIKGASEFNLKNIDVRIPLNNFVCLTGVSGSGKSTLILDILANSLSNKLHRAKNEIGKHKAISGIKFLDKVVSVDQSPIGRTPRSNLTTYTNLFTYIRDIFANMPEAQAKKLDASKFSFNLRGGRCETCRGDGVLKIEMHFLPDVYVTCPDCKGKRYNPEILEITFKGKTIADVLEMTVEDALVFFKDFPEICDKLKVLESVGLGYMHLGQPANTLSGGEAQRIKLSAELSRHDTGRTLYILDEPTTGLHFEDIKRLLVVLQALVDKGNTVVVIEHNTDVIKSADWIVDLGPEGGEGGGQIVAEGTPEQVAKIAKSYTGQYLKEVLKN
ncbi:MAG: excinuclease ABC subunit UvrA [Patescibacteria group bacterium]|nr:excinuclease ABC subunit UvrA [Patescibacteria group bacterium]